jgi:hypothetical protein
VVVAPAQTAVLPLIVPADGAPLTVTEAVATDMPQLLETLYEIVAVPIPVPVTIPVVFTLAIVASLVLHVPPVPVTLYELTAPMQTDDAPAIVPAVAPVLTVIPVVAVAVPQLLVTE